MVILLELVVTVMVVVLMMIAMIFCGGGCGGYGCDGDGDGRLVKNELHELCGVQLFKRFSVKLVNFSPNLDP